MRRETKFDRIEQTRREQAKKEGLRPEDIPRFRAKEKTCAYDACGRPGMIESVIMGKFYCSVEHRNADRARTD